MISVPNQIERGVLVCPQTRTRLAREGDFLISQANTKYRVTGAGVPILLADAVQAEHYAGGSSHMLSEYSEDGRRGWAQVVSRLTAMLNQDYRTKASRN